MSPIDMVSDDPHFFSTSLQTGEKRLRFTLREVLRDSHQRMGEPFSLRRYPVSCFFLLRLYQPFSFNDRGQNAAFEPACNEGLMFIVILDEDITRIAGNQPIQPFLCLAGERDSLSFRLVFHDIECLNNSRL